MQNIPERLIMMALVIISIAIHELAHAKFADWAGDPTPRAHGRITLNPFKHFDQTGLLLIIISSLMGFGFGYGITPVNPTQMRNPRWDYFVTVLAGPIANLAQAVIYAIALRFYMGSAFIGSWTTVVLVLGCLLNINLFLFNLLPLGMLDGQTLIALLLPPKARLSWTNFQRSFGTMLLFGLILFSNLTSESILLKPAFTIFRLITGLDTRALGYD